MNIFVTDTDPIQSALNLPDKHVVKMPLETCQMLAIIYSDWYYGVGQLHKLDGTPYRTAHGAFRNHPCTQWAAANQYNLAWLIQHGYALSAEYHSRYDKVHSCRATICEAADIYDRIFDIPCSQAYHKVTDFTRAMPEYLKFDTTIDTITAYQRYLNTKPWLASNYLRIPSRKPSFITTMKTVKSTDINYNNDLPVFDFSDDDAVAKAIKEAEAAISAPKSEPKGLVPTPKAAKTSPAKKGKAGRIVGISKDENELLQNLLQSLTEDPNYSKIVLSDAFAKIQARYNK